MKVAIYARVSTDDKGQDPLNQLLELREFASRQDVVVNDFVAGLQFAVLSNCNLLARFSGNVLFT